MDIFKKHQQALYLLGAYMFITVLFGGIVILKQGVPNRLSSEVIAYANSVDDINPRRNKCHQPNTKTLNKSGPCKTNGSVNVAPTFISFGDSFSTTIDPLLEHLSQKHNISGLQSSYSSCPPLLGISRKKHIKGSSSYDCAAFNQYMFDYIKAHHIKNVVLFARWSAYMHEYPVEVRANKKKNFKKAFKEQLNYSLNKLDKNNVTVWIVEQPPEQRFDIPSSLAKAERYQKNIKTLQTSYSQHKDRQKEINSIFDDIKQDRRNFPNVRFITLSPSLCSDKQTCLISHEGKSLYRDQYHLSQYGVDFVSPLFDDMFKQMVHQK